MRRWVRRGAVAVAAILVLFVGFEAFAVVRAKLRTPEILVRNAHPVTSLGQLGKRRVAILLRVEDPGFFRHRGVDYTTPGQGWTTITQALVKRLYFDGGFKPGFAKIEQSLIARFVFDPVTPKRRQLEMYLNLASFGTQQGRPVIGFADAALTFYKRPPAALGGRQFISLVAMLIAPREFNPLRHPRENAERVRRIEALIAERCSPRDVLDVRYPHCAVVDG